jgi:ABC-type multidrug transport system permease subunit
MTRKREQALLVGILLSVVMFYTSGGIAPVSLMPSAFRYVTYLFPVTHGMTLWNRVFFLDTMTGLWFNSIFLILFWIVGTIIAVRLTDKEVERA